MKRGYREFRVSCKKCENLQNTFLKCLNSWKVQRYKSTLGRSRTHLLQKSFKFMVLILLANTFVSQKIESLHISSFPQAKIPPRFLSLPTRQNETTFFSRTAFTEDLSFPQQKGLEENYGVLKIIKIKPTRVFDWFSEWINLCLQCETVGGSWHVG